MKRKYLIPVLISILGAILSANAFTICNKKDIMVEGKGGFAVVELFTSEGCSSCPPADKAIAELLARNTDNIYVLSYHVDYWNRLGWKDVFSKPEFSARQQQYAPHFSSEGVYTPQVIVNGATQFVGSDEGKLNDAISNNLKRDMSSDLSIRISQNNNAVSVSFDINEQDVVLLNIAIVQLQAATNVKRGENSGRMLHHVNIVREFKTINAKGRGDITIEIPKELSGIPLELIAFTQGKNSFKILGADKKKINI
ncbi:MAG: DUF1223 domain-containing protein [Ferruginibacter sp.]